jgi:glutaredoxin-like protein NrdH
LHIETFVERRTMDWIHVDGENRGAIKLYALSTCGWCRKTKALLNELGVEYEYRDVDLLAGAEREEAIGQIERWNPARSFPTMVINDTQSIVGFKPDKIKEVLGDGS